MGGSGALFARWFDCTDGKKLFLDHKWMETGDILGITLELDKDTLVFKINEEMEEVGFENVQPGNYRLALGVKDSLGAQFAFIDWYGVVNNPKVLKRVPNLLNMCRGLYDREDSERSPLVECLRNNHQKRNQNSHGHKVHGTYLQNADSKD